MYCKLKNMETKKQVQTSTLSNILPHANVSTVERILMIAGGSYVLYKALSGNKKDIMKSTLGGSMLLRGISGYCPIYDAVDSVQNSPKSHGDINIKSIINKPVNEVYDFWRNLENLPKFMTHLESVKSIDNKTSEWVAKGPSGIGSLSWKAQIIHEQREKLLSWQSMADSSIENSGRVSFKSLGQSTEIEVTISYKAPLGTAGELAAKLLNPLFTKLVKTDVENFKSFMEVGEVNK